MSMLFFLIQRALAKAFGQAAERTGDTSSPHRQHSTQDIVETIWVGMSASQLRNSFGSPKAIRPTPSGEVWTYSNLSHVGGDTDVVMGNGVVQSWGNKPSAALSAGP